MNYPYSFEFNNALEHAMVSLALASFTETAREEYADGSGAASTEELALQDMQKRITQEELRLDNDMEKEIFFLSLEYFYDVARSEYADGSGQASVPQKVTRDLKERVLRIMDEDFQKNHDDFEQSLKDEIETLLPGINITFG